MARLKKGLACEPHWSQIQGYVLRKVATFSPLVLAAYSRLRNATNSSLLGILFSVERLMITLASEWADFFICLLQ